jgi:hypothetical protein
MGQVRKAALSCQLSVFYAPVILSGATASHREAVVESKDPYS